MINDLRSELSRIRDRRFTFNDPQVKVIRYLFEGLPAGKTEEVEGKIDRIIQNAKTTHDSKAESILRLASEFKPLVEGIVK